MLAELPPELPPSPGNIPQPYRRPIDLMADEVHELFMELREMREHGAKNLKLTAAYFVRQLLAFDRAYSARLASPGAAPPLPPSELPDTPLPPEDQWHMDQVDADKDIRWLLNRYPPAPDVPKD